MLSARYLAARRRDRYHDVAMDWRRGLRRLRLVGTVALLLGVAAFASVFLTNLLGYAPDNSFQPLFALMGRLGLILTLFGCLVSLAAWVLQGFVPAATAVTPSKLAHPRD